VGAGLPLKAISRQLGVSRAAIREWAADPDRALALRAAPGCFVEAGRPCDEPATYAYLLGQYLGDGYLVTTTRSLGCASPVPTHTRASRPKWTRRWPG